MWEDHVPLLMPDSLNNNTISLVSQSLHHSALQIDGNATSYFSGLPFQDKLRAFDEGVLTEDNDFEGLDSWSLLEEVGHEDNMSVYFNISQFLWSVKNSRNSTENVFKKTINVLNLYFTPFIIVIGIIGNTMSLLVFSLTHLQRLSSSFYLSSLALADVGFLMGLCVVWLQRVNVNLYAREGWCQGVQYLTKVCGFLAMWNVVSFTMERYIIVYHPLRKDTFCTKHKARIVVLCLVIFALSLYSYKVWVYDVVQFFNTKKSCSPLPQYYDIVTILSCLDTLFACVIPSVLIVVLNVRIMMKIHDYQTRRTEPTRDLMIPADKYRRRSLVHTSISTTGSMHIKFSSSRLPERNSTSQWQEVLGVATSTSKKKVLRSQSQFRTARMLLILSSVFVLLNLPSHAFRVQGVVSRVSGGKHKTPAERLNWHEFFQILYFLNFAINFFIYSACGRQFRTGLKRLCRKWKYKIQKCGKVIKVSGGLSRSQQPERENDAYNLKIRAL